MEKDVVSFVCNECRYRFRRNADWNKPLCPYCGKPGTCRADNEVNKMINEII